MSAIEWTEQTWNPVTGCDRVSPGCDNCYALTLAKRLKAMGQPRYQRDGDPRTSGPGFGLTVHPDALDIPLRRRKPTLWFVNSMSDLFHRDVPPDFIAAVFARMLVTPQHTYQVLTKRPQRMARLLDDPQFGVELGHLAEDMLGGRGVDPMPFLTVESRVDAGGPLFPNVWLGTSIEFDHYAWRADHLRAADAAIRFLSLEPLLGPLPSLDLTGIDWVIVGGESGPGARPMQLAWVDDILARCRAAGVPAFVKQLGSALGQPGDPKGGDPAFWPPELRVREYPRPATALSLPEPEDTQ